MTTYGYFYTFCRPKINKLRAMFIVYSRPESSTVFRFFASISVLRLESFMNENNDAASKSSCPHFVVCIDYRTLIIALFDV